MAYLFNAVGAVTQLTSDDNYYGLSEYAITVVNSGVISFEIAFDPTTDFPYITYYPLASTAPIAIEVPFTDIWTKGSVAVQSDGTIVYALLSDPSTGPSKVITAVITPAGVATFKSKTIGTGDETITGVSATGVIRVEDSVKGTLYVNTALNPVSGTGVSFAPIATTTDSSVTVSLGSNSRELDWTYGGTTSVLAKLDSDPNAHYSLLGTVANGNSIGAIVSDGTTIYYYRTVAQLFTASAQIVSFDSYQPGNNLAGLSNALGGDDTVFLPANLAAWGLTGGFHGGDGNDLIVAGPTGTTIWGDAGVDRVVGGIGNDILYGGTGNGDDFAGDFLSGNGGVNKFYVGSDDTVTDASPGDTIIIPAGAVTLSARKYDGSYDVSFQQTKNGTVQTSVVHVQSGKFVRLVASTVGNETTLTVVESHLAPAQSWDINGDLLTDIVFRSTSGQFSDWQISGTSIIGSGNLNGGTSGRLVGMGDIDGNGYTDGVFVRADGSIATWLLYGASLPGGATIGNPGTAFTALAVADFTGDHRSEILFRNNQNGTFAIWKTNSAGTALNGGGAIANPGVDWVYKATADFNGDGTSDILFQRADGTYGVWLIKNSAIAGGGAVGNPGASWFYKGVGDFNGDGKADILFENVNGTYATWNLDGTTVLGGGLIDKAASTAMLVGIGDYNGDEKSDLLFRALDGGLSTVTLSDHTVIGGGSLGTPSGTAIAQVHGASTFETLVFQNTGTSAISTWTVGTGVVVSTGTVGSAGAGWTAIATGDFAGTGELDVLQTDGAGHYRSWAVNGSTMLGSTTVGTVNNNTFIGVGDFNGDGRTDILFQNPDNGIYYEWTMNGGTVLNVGIIGAASGFTFAGLADFNGDGKSDILFKNTSTGDYAAWAMDGSTIIGGGVIANPGNAWALAGTGDFNGDGKSDMLFLNTNGTYAIWDLNGTTITGGGAIGNPGAGWSLAKIADINQDGKDDLVFVNGAGDYASWLLNNNQISGGGVIGHATGLHTI